MDVVESTRLGKDRLAAWNALTPEEQERYTKWRPYDATMKTLPSKQPTAEAPPQAKQEQARQGAELIIKQLTAERDAAVKRAEEWEARAIKWRDDCREAAILAGRYLRRADNMQRRRWGAERAATRADARREAMDERVQQAEELAARRRFSNEAMFERVANAEREAREARALLAGTEDAQRLRNDLWATRRANAELRARILELEAGR